MFFKKSVYIHRKKKVGEEFTKYPRVSIKYGIVAELFFFSCTFQNILNKYILLFQSEENTIELPWWSSG